MAQPCSILPMPVGQISPSHLGTCLRLPGLGSLRPRLALVSLPISPLGTQPEARCPVPPHGAPKEHNLLLWVHVIVRLGAHGWGGSLVHVGGVASSRVCRSAHKPVGGSGALARGSGEEHFCVFLGCGRTKGPLSLGLWLWQQGPGYQVPS